MVVLGNTTDPAVLTPEVHPHMAAADVLVAGAVWPKVSRPAGAPVLRGGWAGGVRWAPAVFASCLPPRNPTGLSAWVCIPLSRTHAIDVR
jgi:hypothetical protein